jgi:hypothetical protein
MADQLTEVLFFWGEILKTMNDQGYSHKIKCVINRKEKRVYIYLADENDYHVREYGNPPYAKAIIWLDAYLNGLKMGLMLGY